MTANAMKQHSTNTKLTGSIWKTVIALVIAVASVTLSTQAETLTIQYTKEDGSSHTLLIEEDVEVLRFDGATSLTLPDGLVNLRELSLCLPYDHSLRSLKLPEDLGKDVTEYRISGVMGFRLSIRGGSFDTPLLSNCLCITI